MVIGFDEFIAPNLTLSTGTEKAVMIVNSIQAKVGRAEQVVSRNLEFKSKDNEIL